MADPVYFLFIFFYPGDQTAMFMQYGCPVAGLEGFPHSFFPFPSFLAVSLHEQPLLTGIVIALDIFQPVSHLDKVAKVVHGNRSDNHYNWSNIWRSMLLPKLY